MKIRKLTAFLLVLAMLASLLSACKITSVNQGQPAEGEPSGMLLWKVTGAAGGELYLLGSIHVGDKSLYPLPEIVTDAYEAADLLAVEADIVALERDMEALTELSMIFTYTDGTTIRDHLPAELYEKARAYLEEIGSYGAAFDYMHPAMWTSLLDLEISDACGLKDRYGVDRHFLERAHDDGKEIYELESAKMQYEMMAGFSDELSALLLRSSLTDREAQKEEMRRLYELYKSGDFAAFSAYITEEPEGLTEEELALYAEYTYEMMDARNAGMAEQALELLASGEVCFYIVGAAHMVGETGLVNALTEAGCTVEQQ